MISQYAAGLVASENVVLKVEGPLRGIDYLCARPESVRTDAKHAKCGFAWMLMRGTREMAAENGIFRVNESHRLVLRKIGTRRTPRTRDQGDRSQHGDTESDEDGIAGEQRRGLLE